MEGAKTGHTVKFQGLKGASHLNDTEGTLIKYIKKEGRWSVRCDANNSIVKAKPENLILRRNYANEDLVISDDDLFNKPQPPREECPICFIPLDLDPDSCIYKGCCGKKLCIGCAYGIVEAGIKRELPCAFCRTPEMNMTDKERLKRIKKRMKANDAQAFFEMGYYYREGKHGVRQNYVKSVEHMEKAAKLGLASANYNLGCSYHNGDGVQRDMKKAKHYWSLAAVQGDLSARHSLAGYEFNNEKDISRAMKHYRLAAEHGNPDSMRTIHAGILRGYVTKNEYEEILRSHNEALELVKSDERDKAREIAGISSESSEPPLPDPDLLSMLSKLGLGG